MAGRRREALWTAVLAAALAIASLVDATPARAQAPAPHSASETAPPPPPAVAGAPSFGECEAAVDEAELRDSVRESARAAMRDAAERVDYGRIVRESWLAARFDLKFAEIVDAKIAVLRADRSYLERLLDGNVPSRAREMAERTATLVFESAEFEALQKDLQFEIGERLRPLAASAEIAANARAADCVKTFLGARYADAVSAAFSDQAGAADVDVAFASGGAGASAAISLAGVIAGMLAVVFRRLVRRIVAAAVRRLAGAIAARLAAWASVVLGAALLVYELIAGADGVFPVIRDELLSDDTRLEIQTSLVEELSVEGPKQLEARAGEIAGLIFDRWRAFKANHRATLELAEAEPRFRAFMEEQPPERFEALSSIVALVKAAGDAEGAGDAAVMRALDEGVLNDALRIPNISRVAEAWRPRGLTLQDIVAWRVWSGDGFERALRLGLPDAMRPGEISREALDRLLAFDNAEAARRVAAMAEPARSDALSLPPEQLSTLSRRFGGDQLENLLDALRVIESDALRRDYLQRIVSRPDLMRRFASSGVSDTVAGSRSPRAALDILLDPAPLWSPVAFKSHVDAVLDGEAAPLTLAHRYGWFLAIALGVPALIALGFLRWSLGVLGLRRRRRPA